MGEGRPLVTKTLTEPHRRSTIKIDVARMRLESAVDAARRAEPATWRRLSYLWDWAAPRLDDYTGKATPDEISERALRCRGKAAACRLHATLLAEQADAPLPHWILEAVERETAHEWSGTSNGSEG